MGNSILNWIALFILTLATLSGAYWVWGLLFIFWSVKGLWNPTTTLITPSSKESSPFLFWTINLMWLAFGIWYLIYDLLWRFGIYSIFGMSIYPNFG